MRILYYHQHFSTPHGSTGTRSYEMAKRLIKRGHSVLVVCGSYAGANTGLTDKFKNGQRRGFVEEIEVIELLLPYSNRDSFLKRTFTFLKFAYQSTFIALKENYDVLFATSTPLTIGIPGILASLLKRKKFVFEVRDLWPELPREMKVITNPIVLSFMSILEWASYHAADKCVGLSPGIVEGIQKRGIDSSRVHLIPNGSDLSLFNEDSDVPWRPSGVSDSDYMTVFTGTHGIANGLDALIEVAKVLKKRGRDDIKFVLIGDGKLKPALVEQARKENLTNCVFHAPVPKTRLSGLMRSADSGLMILANVPAFYYGTSPNKFFDYIAAGIPVVNNYPGWVADMITAHDCGIAIPPEEPEKFADALVKLADNKALKEKMGNNGKNLAREKFSREILADQLVDVLESICC
jgi:glycosyltransferase involved in cell wall biosynthesis